MKELWYGIKRFISNVYLYRKLLWKDEQYDYGYLLNLEKFKMQLMLDYFKSSPCVDHTNDIRWISICIKLIDIINENDSALEFDNTVKLWKDTLKLTKYVNIKNSSRYNLYSQCHNSKLNTKYVKNTLRQEKALYLYHKIRYNYICKWWD